MGEAKTKEEKYRKIRDTKEKFPLDKLCEGYPAAFQTYLQTTRDMQFGDRPDYVSLRKLWTDELEKQGFENNFDFDWYRGKKPERLTPLPPWVNPPQPDDPKTGAAGSGTKEVGKKSCCSVSR